MTKNVYIRRHVHDLIPIFLYETLTFLQSVCNFKLCIENPFQEGSAFPTEDVCK
jgi:hypothetical protein